MNQVWIGRGAIVLSLVIHGGILSQTAGAKPLVTPEEATPAPVHFTVAPLPEPEPEAVPEPEPEPEPEPPLALPEPITPKAPEPAAEEPPPASKEPPTDPPPVDELPAGEVSGTTLVADGVGDFSAPVGSGEARKGAFRSKTALPKKVLRASSRKVVVPAPLAPEVVPIKDLKKPPAPPFLGDALKRNYPSQAKQQGRSGEAKIRAKVDKNGRVTVATIAMESSSGFGQACRKTLLDSHWSAPLNKEGKEVATWISYRCKFRIDD
jgi:TonB family protein